MGPPSISVLDLSINSLSPFTEPCVINLDADRNNIIGLGQEPLKRGRIDEENSVWVIWMSRSIVSFRSVCCSSPTLMGTCRHIVILLTSVCRQLDFSCTFNCLMPKFHFTLPCTNDGLESRFACINEECSVSYTQKTLDRCGLIH